MVFFKPRHKVVIQMNARHRLFVLVTTLNLLCFCARSSCVSSSPLCPARTVSAYFFCPMSKIMIQYKASVVYREVSKYRFEEEAVFPASTPPSFNIESRNSLRCSRSGCLIASSISIRNSLWASFARPPEPRMLLLTYTCAPRVQ